MTYFSISNSSPVLQVTGLLYREISNMSTLTSSITPIPGALDTAMPNLKATTSKLSPIIDLHCYACSPTPSFTNTSHLLTHLASKTHLRTLFELELCATHCGDEECARALERFHNWYYQEKVGDHLVDRFIIKKGKWSREKLKPELEPKAEGNRVTYNFQEPVQCKLENKSEAGLAQIPMISAFGEDRKRKRDEVPDSNHFPPVVCLEGPSKPVLCAPKACRNGRRPLVSIMNESLAKAIQLPIEEPEISSLYTNASSSSSLNQLVDESGSNASNQDHEEQETLRAIVDGPDRGIIYCSLKGPRLRGKVWPGMGVFDTSFSANTRRDSHISTSSATPKSGIIYKNHFATKRESIASQMDGPFSPAKQYMSTSPLRDAPPPLHDFFDPAMKKMKSEPIASDRQFLDAELEVELGIESELDAEGDIDEDLELVIRQQLPKVGSTVPPRRVNAFYSGNGCPSSIHEHSGSLNVCFF